MNLITGGAGFLGTNLTKKLLEKDEAIRIYDLEEPVPELSDKVEFIRGDILDKEKLNNACKNISTVYHTAALVPVSKAGRRFEDINVQGTLNAVDASLKNAVGKFVHISSSAVYDLSKMPITEESPIKPLGLYGNAKHKAELIVMEGQKRGLDYVIVRPRTIVGDNRAGIFQILYDWLYHGKTIYIFGDGSNSFQLISASDLCEACYAASKTDKSSGEIINIGNEQFGTFQELIEDLISHAGTGSEIKHINAFFARTTLRILDKIKLSPLADWHYLTLEKPFYFDITKAKNLLAWRPRDSNKDMITKSYDWYVAHREEVNSKKGTTHRVSPRQRLLTLLKKLS
ncbi:NAD-dependent epimerase/dehydratase family protein [Chloroflexota bacterium]